MRRRFFCCRVLMLVAMLSFATGSVWAQKKIKEKVWKKETEQIVIFDDDKDDGIHHLKDVSKETTFFNMLMDAIGKGELKVYADQKFATLLAVAEIDGRLKLNSIEEDVEDPVTGQTHRVTRYKTISSATQGKYKILNEWTFFPSTGKAESQVAGIAPVTIEYHEESKAVRYEVAFWFKYKDVQDMLAKYAEYHPENSLAIQVWEDYFLNDAKPSQAK